jgi:hypothetical protein
VGNKPAEVSFVCKKGFKVDGNDLVENQPFAKKLVVKPMRVYIWKVTDQQQ